MRTGETVLIHRSSNVSADRNREMMAEKQAEDDDDEGFGDFKFVSYSSGNLNSNQNNRENNDEWGDFVDTFSQKQDLVGEPFLFEPANGVLYAQNPGNLSETPEKRDPLGFFSDQSTKSAKSQPNHVESENNTVSPAAEKRWEKPQGALPLSIFGVEEEEADRVEPSLESAPDMVFTKPAAAPKNGLNFESSININDLIVNFYGHAEQIKTENGSNTQLIDKKGDYGDDGWEFKDASSETRFADTDVEMKEKQVSVLSGAELSATTILSETQVDEKGKENSEGATISELCDVKHESTDLFIASNGFPQKPAELSIEFDVNTSVITHNNGISDSYGKSKQGGYENGLNSSYSSNGYVDSDENFWDFKDAFSETGAGNYSSGQKEEEKAANMSSGGLEVFTSATEILGNGSTFENHQESLPQTITINGNLDHDGSLDKELGFSYNSKSSVGSGVRSHSTNLSFNDILSTLYNQTPQIPAVDSTRKLTENALSSPCTDIIADLVNEEDDYDTWEFKDAFSEAIQDDEVPVSALKDKDQQFPTESKLKKFLDFYCRMKDESYLITYHHLDGLKKAQEVAAHLDDNMKAVELHEEIQEAYRKMQTQNMVSEEVYSDNHSRRTTCLDKLLGIITQDPMFEVLESAYHLSKQINLAENDLSSAIGLFEHSISILKILNLGSTDEQLNYATIWFKMISACAQELKHGVVIWKKSLQANVHKQVLSEPQGQRYFLALGEIYRTAEVLRITATLYKPWTLASLVDPTEMFTLFDECSDVWSKSGLEEALHSISNLVVSEYDGSIKSLMESIRFICDLDVDALQNRVFLQEDQKCRLSLLPMRLVPDMKVVVWNGEHYFLTLANLWVNRISHDPPTLASIHVG